MRRIEAQPVSGSARYDVDRFWTTRLEREFTLAGVGYAGLGLAFNKWAYRVRRRVLLRALAGHGITIQGARLLELGFGTGFYLDIWLREGVQHVSGFDITEIAVKAARERFAQMNWRFERADIGVPLPLEDGDTYDVVTAFDVLFHLVQDSKWTGALDNMAARLRTGGHALIFDKFQETGSKSGHVRSRTLASYRGALESRGFDIIDVRPIFFLMNSPKTVDSWKILLFKGSWSVVKASCNVGNRIGLSEFVGNVAGALLFYPELALGHFCSFAPSTQLLIAKKR